jgi:hypothetical protein
VAGEGKGNGNCLFYRLEERWGGVGPCRELRRCASAGGGQSIQRPTSCSGMPMRLAQRGQTMTVRDDMGRSLDGEKKG